MLVNVAAKKSLEQRILDVLAELEAITGGKAMAFLLPNDTDKPVGYGFEADTEKYVSRLYDAYFPSLISEVKAIESMGAAVLALEYGFHGIDMLLEECNTEIEDDAEREKINNILLEARGKIQQHCNKQNQRSRRQQ